MAIQGKRFPSGVVAAAVIVLEVTLTFATAYFVHRAATPVLQALCTLEQGRESTIEFYGSVVDEAQRPVSGAKIVVIVESANWAAQFNAEGDVRDLSIERQIKLQTDGNGRFAIEAIRGYSVGVEEIQKDGYEWVPEHTANSDGAHFGYGSFGSGRPWNFLSAPSRPIVFHLRRSTPGVP